MSPSLSDDDRDLLDGLAQGRRIFAVICSRDTYNDWEGRHLAAFESSPDTDQSSWDLFTEISSGDILIAFARQGENDYFYGIGRAAGSFDESVPRIVRDLKGDDYRYQIPVDWITVDNAGERLDKSDIQSLPDDTVSEVDYSRFDEILAAIDRELGEDAPWSRSAYDFLSNLQKIAESDRLEEITIAAMSQRISRDDDVFDVILPVVRAFLTETDTSEPTGERRAAAVELVADDEDDDPHTILERCIGEGIHPRTVEEINEKELQRQFDSSLERIEDRWARYEEGPTRPTYVVRVDTAYKPKVTQPNLALNAASLEDDAATYPEAKGRVLYVEDGRCRGEAIVSETVDNTDSDGGPFFWIFVEEYTEFPSIDIEELETDIGRDFDEDVGCVKLTAREARELPSPPNTVGTTGFERERIAELLNEEEGQGTLYRNSMAHLVAGKNLLLYGPPGTGKTRAADLLTEAMSIETKLVTANAEWSNHRVVGGYEPDEDGWAPTPGFLTETAIGCRTSLRRDARPKWLVIDELNRANLDEAFGEVFTLLDMDYRGEVPIEYGDTQVTLPLSFRIIGTMNTYDQAQLFSLGYAFRRRFAFVEVDSLLHTTDDPSMSDSPDPGTLSTDDDTERVVDIVQDQVPAFFERRSRSLRADVAPIFPEFAVSGTAQETLERLLDDESLQTNGFDFTEAMVLFARETTERDVIDIGQALLIDATKFVVAHALLFPDETTWETVDRALIAYVVPQFEQFMPTLRRAETIEQESDAVERMKAVVGLAAELDFEQTAGILQEALKTKQVLGK
jgi:hypothetical protein